MRAELFTMDASNAYTISFGTQTFNAATASETFAVNFNGLTRGETYQLVVTDNLRYENYTNYWPNKRRDSN